MVTYKCSTTESWDLTGARLGRIGKRKQDISCNPAVPATVPGEHPFVTPLMDGEGLRKCYEPEARRPACRGLLVTPSGQRGFKPKVCFGEMPRRKVGAFSLYRS